jgi:hypothetical protein
MASRKIPADLLQAVVEHFNQRGQSIIVQTETPSL